MSTYLISGGEGFIAGHLLQRLIRDGHTVRTFDTRRGDLQEESPQWDRRIFSPAYEVTPEAFRDLCDGIDAIFHMADHTDQGGSFAARHRSGPTLTMSLLAAAQAAHVPKFVYSSGCCVYGNQQLISSLSEPRPTTVAGAAKAASEAYCLACDSSRLNVRVLRYFHVYGARQKLTAPEQVIASYMRAALAGRATKLPGNGEQVRLFTHVDDVVEANLAALRDTSPQVAHNVFGEEHSLADALRQVYVAVGNRPVPPVLVPAIRDDVHYRVTAPRTLRYPVTTLLNGLEKTVPYYRWLFSPAVATAG